MWMMKAQVQAVVLRVTFELCELIIQLRHVDVVTDLCL